MSVQPETPVRLASDPPIASLEDFASWIAGILSTNQLLPEGELLSLTSAVSTLFTHLRLTSPEDFRSFSSDALVTAITRMASGRATAEKKEAKVALMDNPLVLQRLQVLTTYLFRGGGYSMTLGLPEILSGVHSFPGESTAVVSPLGTSPGSSSRSSTTESSIRTEIPTLPTFDGGPSSFKKWQDSTLTLLGKAGLDCFLTDDSLFSDPSKHSTARRIYFALRAAVAGGTASYLVADPNHSSTVTNPRAAWLRLIDKYNTSLHQSNQVAFLLRDLFALELGSTTSASTFLSRFSEIRAELQAQTGVTIPDLVYRAAILSGLTNTEYSAATLEILKSPDASIDETLDVISTHETLLDNANGDIQRDLTADVDQTTVRRAHTSPDKKVSFSSGTKRDVPYFPGSWKKAFKGVFTYLVEWRSDAIKGMSQEDLNKKYQVQVKRSKLPDSEETPSGDNSNQQQKKKHKKSHKVQVVSGRRIITSSG